MLVYQRLQHFEIGAVRTSLGGDLQEVLELDLKHACFTRVELCREPIQDVGLPLSRKQHEPHGAGQTGFDGVESLCKLFADLVQQAIHRLQLSVTRRTISKPRGRRLAQILSYHRRTTKKAGVLN